ncbi:MAG TPA: hypothetical protein VH143_18900 [Kofleriaceae bacterium]|jgi:hypothetical protein|nr:hypothetical protein [Kofleriaceae bacterium]
MMVRLLAPVLVGLVAIGCGDNLEPATDAGEAFAEVMPGAGLIPQVINSGGTVFASPIVQPIFFGSAADTVTTEPYVEAFLGQLTTSDYWKTIGEEYGVGELTIMPSIVSTDAVPTTDADLVTYLTAQLDGTHAGWPVADVASTIYMVQLPAGQTFSGACTSFGGYHSEAATSPSVTGYSYAVIANCGAAAGGTPTALDEVTVTISHELIEAATDPKVATNPAYESTDNEHLAWSREAGAEVGDMCEWTPSAQQVDVGTYMIQRIWSNKSALAGHDPCVPVLATPYFNAAPSIGDVALTTRNGSIMVQGVTIPVGSSQEITFTLFSDAPVAADWELSVIDGAELLQGASSFAFDYGRVTTGHNGQNITVSVRREKAATSHGNLLFVENRPAADDTQVPSFWWIFAQ